MKIKLSLCLLCALILGVVGCNLFNPTESANINSGDANALTYEGYIKFRANDYSEAERYFNKAIEADSGHSEAWYGLAKARINLLEVNVFELLKYVNTDEKTSVLPIAGMDDATAQKYQNSVDIVLNLLSEFITRDTTGKLDGVITYNDVYKDCMILEMFQFMLVLRKEMPYVAACKEKDPVSGLPQCSIGDILNGLHGDRVPEALSALNGFAKTCSDKPEAGGSVLGQVLPGFSTMMTAEGQNTTARAACDALASMTEPSDDPAENEKGLSTFISFTGFSQIVDEDGDGCRDEEVFDGQDNDGDGEIDEDSRDQSSEFVMDNTAMAKNVIFHRTGPSNLIIIRSVSPNEKYSNQDIDMNGEVADDDEWDFVYSDYRKRVENEDHRFKFAEKLTFNPKGLVIEEFTALKHEVARDYQGKYNLQYRKENIGGCWVNYTEHQFQEALEAQKARYEE